MTTPNTTPSAEKKIMQEFYGYVEEVRRLKPVFNETALFSYFASKERCTVVRPRKTLEPCDREMPNWNNIGIWLKDSLKSYKKEILEEVEKEVIKLPMFKGATIERILGYEECLQNVLSLLNSLK